MTFSRRPMYRKPSERGDTAIDDGLRSIYGNGDGTIPDMTRFHHRRRKRTNTLFIVFLFLFAFLAGTVAAGIFWFKTSDRFTGEGVQLTITAPEQITSGEEIRYRIRYANNEPLVLGNVELTLRYPRGFTLLEAIPSPTNQSGTTGGAWVIGTLPRGREGTVELVGRLVGGLNTQENLQGLLTYKPANFNAEFQEIASATTTIASSLVSIVIKGPERAVPDTEVVYTMEYENTGEEALANLEVQAQLPDALSITGTKPERSGSSTHWSVAKIEKKKNGTIEIRGKYGKEASGDQKVTVRVGFGKNENFSLQKEDVFTTAIVKGDVFTSLSVNGSTTGNPVNFGDALQYAVAVKNNSDAAMENITVRLLVASPVIDWATLDDKSRGTRDGSTITWSKNTIRDLRLLDPGEEAQIIVGVRVKKGRESLNLEDLVIESRGEVVVGKAKDITTPLTVNTNTIVQKVNTDMVIDNEARYFADDGTKIGDGPLPPRVGQTTTYRIRWTVRNTLHELLNMKATTTLPLPVAFGTAGVVSQGTLLYNPDTREVSWTLQRLPTTVNTATAEFTVMITPTVEMRGTSLPLTGDLMAQARDKITGGLLTLKKSGLSTALDDDEYGRGKGVIEE